MSATEFTLIARLVKSLPCRRTDVLAGPGDDAALLQAPAGKVLVQTVDTCLEGVHFPAGLDAADIGWRSLVVNLSDLAAMGADPAWGLLSLSLPAADEAWLDAFARGLGEAARSAGLDIVGGDLVRGPLSITLALTGFVPPGVELRRTGARPGDGIYVTGPLGGGAAGLDAWRAGRHAEAQAFLRPCPRLDEGRSLRGVASAAIDVSDGLLQDLGHLLAAGKVGAEIDIEAVPLAAGARAAGDSEGIALALRGGDDYELCFTVPAEGSGALKEVSAAWAQPPARIGTIRAAQGMELRHHGRTVTAPAGGWDHFRQSSS